MEDKRLYTEDELVAAVYAARVEEREWAAKIADSFISPPHDGMHLNMFAKGADDSARGIAAKIREGA